MAVFPFSKYILVQKALFADFETTPTSCYVYRQKGVVLRKHIKHYIVKIHVSFAHRHSFNMTNY